ncbi:MAG: hypothetical protein AAGH57_08445 [Pseudomonadota bacterium]
MIVGTWAPLVGGAEQPPEELFVSFDEGRSHRLLIVPALFDEANKLRRFTLTLMRALDSFGIDTALPDLPGTNESLSPSRDQSLSLWRTHIRQFSETFRATHCLALRAGAMLAPASLSGWHYSALSGPKLLGTLLRGRVVETREAGQPQTREALLEIGQRQGLRLAGWELNAAMVSELQADQFDLGSSYVPISHSDLGGSALWLRAEPGEDKEQSEALAKSVSAAMPASSDRPQ